MFLRQTTVILISLFIIISFLNIPKSSKARQAENSTCAVNLMLAINAPEEVADDDWTALQDFAQQLPLNILLADEDAGEIQYGIVQYGAETELVLSLTEVDTDYLELDDSHAIVSAIQDMQLAADGDNLQASLEMAQAELASASNTRPNIILILSGNNANAGNSLTTAETIRMAGTHILSVTIGNIDLNDYVKLSGQPANVITIGQYGSLPVIMDILLNNICIAANEPSIPMIDITEDATPTNPNVANNPAVGGRATQIVFASNRDGDSEIFVINSDGTNLRQLTENTRDDDKPSFKKDGTQIAFESSLEGHYDIFVMDIDGENLTNVTDSNYDSWGPAWSPDGTQIAFHSNRAGSIEIFVMDADGENVRQLTQNAIATDRSAEWSPDGTQLIYYSDVSGGRELYIVDVASGEIERLTNNSYYDGQPDWSLNGTQIAFASTRANSRPDIFIMQLDKSETTRLTDDIATDDDPVWSPDGRQIAFESTRSGNYDIWIMNTDGTGLVQLTDDDARDWSADWAWIPAEE